VARRIEAAADVLARALAVCGFLLLLVFAVMTLADGSLRASLSMPIDAVDDLGGLVVAVAVACCFPLAFLQRANIAIKFLEIFFGRRVGQTLDAFAAVVVALLVIFMARQFFIYAGDAARGGDSTVVLETPTAPFWYAVAAIMTFTAFAQILVALVEIRRCLHGHGAARDSA
jgi:TRAP-type C4-dicarboxylate transport system permease small subunit